MLDLSYFSRRANFNLAARQIRATIAAVDSMADESQAGLYPVLSSALEQSDPNSVLPMISLLAEKYGYSSVSLNLGWRYRQLPDVQKMLSSIQSHDVLLVCHNFLQGVFLVGTQATASVDLQKNQLVVLYARYLGEDKAEQESQKDTAKLLSGLKEFICQADVFDFSPYQKSVRAPQPQPMPVQQPVQPKPNTQEPPPQVLLKPDSPSDSPSEKPAAEPLKFVVSPMYAVQVTNELFHNGNVEAWKNIIESFKMKNVQAEVVVYHKEERIANLNSLFKWGKVKHGDSIVFRVKAPVLKDLAKLKRYLYEGASNRFEKFLHKEVNSHLKLF